MTKIIQRIFLLFILLNLIMPQIAYAAPPWSEVDSDVALRGAIFSSDATGLYASYENGQIHITSDGTGAHIRNIKFKGTAITNRLKNYNGFIVGVTHIADDGTISHYVDSLKIDNQGFAYATYEFSETIISGLTGTTTFTETGLSGNYTKTFNEVNASYIDFNITNHDSVAYMIGGNDYAHRRLLTLNQTAENLTDFQVQKNQTWYAGMQSDMRDNTYTYFGNNTELSFWDELVINNTSKMTWHKIPATSTVDTTRIWYYYGNPSVGSASNGTATFLQYHGPSTIDYIDSLSITPSNIIYESYLKVTSATHNNLVGLSNSATAADDGMFFQLYNVGNLRRGINENEDTSTIVSEEPDIAIDTYVNLQMVHDGATIHYYIDDNEISTGSTTNFPNENLGLFLWNPVGTLVQDWSFVRKHTTTEPTWLADGAEQSPSVNMNITTSVTGDTNTTNYTTDIPQTHTLTPSANITEIVFNTTSSNWDYIATLYWTNDITLSESASNGEYHANVTATVPLNLDNGTLNYTITNTTLLNADFSNYIQLLTNDSNFNESASNLTLPDISLHTTATIGTYYYDLQYDYFYPPQNLTADPAITSVALNWTQTPNADNYSIYELEEGIPWFDTPPTLDGIIDSIYNTTSHHFHILSPNNVNPNDFDFFFMGRDAVWVYLAGTAIDDDAVAIDDYAKLYIDFSKDGLTTDDRMYQIRETGATTRYAWSGSSWAISPGSGVGGVTTGAGTNLITYELRVPVSELPASWVTGLETKMLLERECTSLQPDVQSFYPYGNINNTDTSIWQDIKLTNESEYAFIANTTNTDYIDQDLIPFNWYRYAVSAWNQTNETSFTIVNVTTLDYPTYNISGYILDNSTGFGIPNAVVWAENGLVSHRETTNASGYYNHAGFHNGTYKIYANATNYDENSTAPFTISGANITNKNVTLIYNPFIPTAVDVNDYAYSIVIPYYISNESLRLAPLKLENATVFTMYPNGNVTYDVSYSTSIAYSNNSTGIVRMYSDDQFALYHNSSGQTVFIKSHINPTSTDSDMNPSLMPYQIYMMLISIVILLIYFTFTVSDPEYYTDIITALFAMLISAIVAHNSIMGVLIMYPLQTEVQYDIYASAPLGIVFALVSLLMLLIFVTKILDLGHRETDSL